MLRQLDHRPGALSGPGETGATQIGLGRYQLPQRP